MTDALSTFRNWIGKAPSSEDRWVEIYTDGVMLVRELVGTTYELRFGSAERAARAILNGDAEPAAPRWRARNRP